MSQTVDYSVCVMVAMRLLYIQAKYNESLDVYRTIVILCIVDAFICIWISFFTCIQIAFTTVLTIY